jgi:hypothetical protein
MEKSVSVKQILDSLKEFDQIDQNEIIEEVVSSVKNWRTNEISLLEGKKAELELSLGGLPRFSKTFPPHNTPDPIEGRKMEVYA